MIAANELRIGNWVMYDNRLFQIEAISRSLPCLNTDEFGIGVVDRNNINPIPITPEILEKCGFEWSIYHQAWHKQGFVFDLSERSVCGFFMHKSRLNSEIICPEIQYLHQLQNLYFALTGEEINYTI